MDNKYLYTIIIPHYNIPKLLSRCLYSIPQRDDLQVIVVDDKSTDSNLIRLKELEEEFKNVSFIYSIVNGGGGKARNVGLQNARGRYILFADADDFFNYCLNDILDEYRNSSLDVVYFNANSIDTDSYLPSEQGNALQNIVNTYNKNHDLGVFEYLFGEPWCKMVRRKIIVENGIRFDEIPIHNDTRFSYLVGFFAKNVKFDNRALYCRADRVGSVSRELSNEKFLIRTEVFARKNKFLKDNNLPYFDNLMITPFWNFLFRHDRTNFNKCLCITKSYGFGLFFVIRKMMYFKVVNLIRRLK